MQENWTFFDALKKVCLPNDLDLLENSTLHRDVNNLTALW